LRRMSETGEPLRYVSAARALHWVTALLVLSTLPAGLVMVQEGLSRPLQNGLFLYHKNIGPIVLILVLLRLVLRVLKRPPPMPDSVFRPQAIAAGVVHALLYLTLLLMAVSGIIRVQAGGYPMEFWDPLMGGLIGRDETLAEAASAFHALCKTVLIVLIAGHVGAAMIHGLIKRDGVFSRMWPPV
jgi:cytochrome b561